MRREFGHGLHTQGQESDEWVEDNDRQPHIAQGEAKDARFLRFDVISGAFKTADAQHGGAEAEK